MATKILNHFKVKIVFKYNLLFVFILMFSLSFHVLAEIKPSKTINLTEEEQQWIKDHPVVTFTGDPNWLPYEAFDDNGNYIGIVSEYLKIISSESGLQFKMSQSKSWTESVNKAKSGEVDVLSETDDSDLKSHLSFTIPYISNPIVMVMRNNENYVENINAIKNKKIALIKNYGYASKIRRKYSEINFIMVGDIQDGLISISTGKNDALLCTLALCSYTISELGLNNVKITGKSEFDTRLSLGVQKTLPILRSILNKSIKLISNEQQQVILSHWIKNKTIVFKDYSLVIKVSVVFAIVFLIFIIWNRRLSNEIALRKKAEKENKKSERTLHSQAEIIKQIHDSVISTDLDGFITSWNKGAVALFGYTSNEVLGTHALGLHPESEHEKINQEIIPALKKNGEHELETKFLRKSGDVFLGHLSLSMLYDDEHNAIGMVGFVIDIDEPKKAELALKESEYFLNKAQETAKIGHWKLNLASNKVFGSNELARIMGVSKEMISVELFMGLVHPDDKEKVFASLEKGKKEGGKRDICYRIIVNGNEKWVHGLGWSRSDSEGNIIEVFGTIQDITKEKLIEVEIEKSSLRFKAMFESIPDAVVYADPERNICMVNQAAISLFGFSQYELYGNQSRMLYAPEDDFKQQGVKYYNPKSENIATPNVITYKNKDGREFPGETLGTVVKLSSGEVLGYLAIIRDITERTLLEEELDSYRDSLEAQIEIRTADLIKARDEAERANQAKSDFLSRMSHELRTPLNAILGFGQMLEISSSTLSDVQNSNVQDILDAGHHLLKLINELLNLARIESGKTELNIEKINISKILYDCKNLISSSIEKRNIEFVDNVSEHQYLVKADFMRLKQIFLNLMSNAVKYNAESGRLIVDSQKVKYHRIRICITDTGKGLADNELSQLFNPFERLNVQSNIEGAGIGLTITKHLIELMGGEIGVESTLGEGSTFWIELKCA